MEQKTRVTGGKGLGRRDLRWLRGYSRAPGAAKYPVIQAAEVGELRKGGKGAWAAFLNVNPQKVLESFESCTMIEHGSAEQRAVKQPCNLLQVCTTKPASVLNTSTEQNHSVAV